MTNRTVRIFTLASSMIIALAATTTANGADRPFQSGELLIQFQTGIDAATQSRAMQGIGATRQEMIRPATNRTDQKGDLVLARLPAGLGVAQAIRDIQAQGGPPDSKRSGQRRNCHIAA